MSDDAVIIGMAAAAKAFHDLKVKSFKMEALLIDSRDLLLELAPECGCSRPDACHACRNHNYAQELVKRIKQLTGDEK